jgi:heme oxygenase
MISQPISNLARLRAGTRDAHARIETVPALCRLLAVDLTHNEYISVLQHLHAFHAHVEPAVSLELSWPAAAAMLDGSRPRALAEDLAWFGASAIPPPVFPAIKGPAEALGALYVIEGSALGARVIARHLTDSIGVRPGAGGSFYCRQDADTARRRWQSLVTLLELPLLGGKATGGPLMAEKMTSGAQETFCYLERWLRTIAIVPGSDHALTNAEAVAS